VLEKRPEAYHKVSRATRAGASLMPRPVQALLIPMLLFAAMIAAACGLIAEATAQNHPQRPSYAPYCSGDLLNYWKGPEGPPPAGYWVLDKVIAPDCDTISRVAWNCTRLICLRRGQCINCQSPGRIFVTWNYDTWHWYFWVNDQGCRLWACDRRTYSPLYFPGGRGRGK
jgi:hypothetical protein